MKKLLLTAFLLMLSTLAEAKTVKVTLTENNTISMRDYFYFGSVVKVMQKAHELDSLLPTKAPIYLILDSGGGSISAGLELIENLKNLKRPVRTITLFAASMGFQTVQGLGTRLIQREGTLMSHKARGGFFGEFPGQLDSRYSFWLRRVTVMEETTVSRTKGTHTLQSYRNLIENEYWCQGADCIKQGFADVLVNATCASDLQGTVEHHDIWFQQGHRIDLITHRDKCPLNTGVIKQEVDISPLLEASEYQDNHLTPAQNHEIITSINERKQKILNNVNRVVHKGY